ncbi:MAG: hypothetical protein LBH59_07450 [Planctomycetaceae bacterium]|jgi:hypothetical protein|nr:hypothetical protein [Planctomycetaceae bacterium]
MLKKRGSKWIDFINENSNPIEKFSIAPCFEGFDVVQVFSQIYNKNLWNSAESRSGPGSTLEETAAIRDILPKLVIKYSIKKFIDIPCGDLNWIKSVELGVEHYFGGDIVTEIIEANKSKYENETSTFEVVNLIETPLPDGDLLLCRDCLIHLSYENINKFLANLHASKIRYLLTTTYTARKSNTDIYNGEWRAINLEIEPFCFPKPLEIIVEGNAKIKGNVVDKSIALWEVNKLPKSLTY